MAGKKKSEESIDVLDIKNDLVKYIDDELDKKIDSLFTQKIRNEFIEEIDNSNRRLIREKNRQIFYKNIIIIILIVIIGYLGYLLYDFGYFDKYFIKDNESVLKDNNKNNDSDEGEVIIDKRDTLEELKEEYGYLLDNIIISKNSKYLDDFYNGNLSDELKKYLVLSLINFDMLEVEDDYNIIDTDTFCIAYNKLFDGEINNSNFDYNGNKIRFLSKLDSYVTDSILVNDDVLISREIINVSVSGDEVIIDTIEGIIEDDKLFNVLTLEEISYKGDSLTNYLDMLNKVKYTFKNNKLVSILK